MSVFCMRLAVTSSASSSGIPSCSSVTTRLNSRFDGSGASSATTPIAPARLWPARSAEASTSRFSGSCSANSLRTLAGAAADDDVEHDGGHDGEEDPERAEQDAGKDRRGRSPARTESQIILVGSRLICATSTSSANPSSHRNSRRCFSWSTAASSASTSLRLSTARSSAGSVTKSPRRETSALFDAEAPERAHGECDEAEHDQDDERHAAARTASARRGTPACRGRPCPSEGSGTRRRPAPRRRGRPRRRRSRPGAPESGSE